MAGLGASSIYTKLDGPPRCRQCDRNLKPMSEGRYYCPCCGEIAQLIERLIGNDGPDSHGWAQTGVARGRTDAHAVVMGAHSCATSERVIRPSSEQQTLDGISRGRKK